MFCRHLIRVPMTFFWPKPAPPCTSPNHTLLHLNPSIPHPNRVLYTQKWAHPHFTSQNQASMVQFLVFWSNQPSLMPHPIVPSLHLNTSVTHHNRVPSTQKWACLHFAGQNQASTVLFFVFCSNQPSLAPHLIAPSLHHNPSVPHHNRVPSTQKRAHLHSLAKTEPPRFSF